MRGGGKACPALLQSWMHARSARATVHGHGRLRHHRRIFPVLQNNSMIRRSAAPFSRLSHEGGQERATQHKKFENASSAFTPLRVLLGPACGLRCCIFLARQDAVSWLPCTELAPWTLSGGSIAM
jgi:hypothetical protein